MSVHLVIKILRKVVQLGQDYIFSFIIQVQVKTIKLIVIYCYVLQFVVNYSHQITKQNEVPKTIFQNMPRRV